MEAVCDRTRVGALTEKCDGITEECYDLWALLRAVDTRIAVLIEAPKVEDHNLSELSRLVRMGAEKAFSLAERVDDVGHGRG